MNEASAIDPIFQTPKYDEKDFFGRRNIVRDATLKDVEIIEASESRVVKAGTLKSVLNALVQYCDEKGIAFPSMSRLADDICISLRTVQRSIKALIKLGIIQVATRVKRNNVYRFFFEPLKKMANSVRQKLLFRTKNKPESTPKQASKASDPQPADPPPQEKANEKKTVIAHDGIQRYAAPKFTPPGKTDQQVAVSPRLVEDIKREAAKIGVKKPSSIDKAISRGVSPAELIQMIEKFPALQRSNEKLTPGGLVYWFENGQFPIELKPAPSDIQRKNEFSSFASRVKLDLVFAKDGRSVDDSFLRKHFWKHFDAGDDLAEARAKFIASCKQHGIRKYGAQK